MAALITLNDVSFQYEEADVLALNEIQLNVYLNDWMTILGKNGSGKSTLGRLLNGLSTPSSGCVTVEGLSTADSEHVWTIRTKVGMVFQNPDHQFVATTVRDDLAFGLENLGLARDEMDRRIHKYAALIGVSSYLDMEPHRLSGGQKQRVAIAGVMAMEPSVIVFDEATSMLDPLGRREVIDTMKMLHKHGTTIVSITHHMEEAMLGNRVIILDKGIKAADDSPRAVFSDERALKKVGLSPPPILTIQKHLEKRDIVLSKLCLTEEELIAELWTYRSKL